MLNKNLCLSFISGMVLLLTSTTQLYSENDNDIEEKSRKRNTRKFDYNQTLTFQGAFTVSAEGFGVTGSGQFNPGGEIVIKPFVVKPDGTEIPLQTIVVKNVGDFVTEEKTFHSPEIGSWIFGYVGTSTNAPFIRVIPRFSTVVSSKYGNYIKLLETEGFYNDKTTSESAQETTIFIYNLFTDPTNITFSKGIYE